jgi:hypothetical protein
MKNKREEGDGAKEAQFELKYCERCGGLWLRPVGGGQIYCVRCAKEMEKLPPSYQAGEDGMRVDTDWDAYEEELCGRESDELDLDAMGGVA